MIVAAEEKEESQLTSAFLSLESQHFSKLFITFTHVNTSEPIASYRDVQIKPESTFLVLRDNAFPLTFSTKTTQIRERFPIFFRIMRAKSCAQVTSASKVSFHKRALA